MSDHKQKALEYSKINKDGFLNQLISLCKLPSVSTDPEAKPAMQETAEWVAEKLTSIGIENIQVMPTAGHPVVYGDHLHAGDDASTVLVYGHYDVQPADPLELWDTPPFEPTLKGGNLYARGASDMKGQTLAGIFAVESILKQGALPVNIKFMIEGEEEIGSPSLEAFIEQNADLLACDFALNPDGSILGADKPSIAYALRGLAYFEIRVQGPAGDLHSGMFGGTVLNPANELARLIAGMQDENGRITLPGFYDDVLEMSEQERDELARLPMDEEYYYNLTGAPMLYGEKGFSPVERTGARPTLDVNGFLSGFTGEGSKTVLPAKAMAKVSMRLVPNQHPDKVEEQLHQYVEENARPGITWEILTHAGAVPSMSPIDSEGVRALAAGMEEVWGKKPFYYRVGGTIPVVGQLETILGAPSVLTGFGLPDDNLHAPNEKLTLEPWYMGIDTLIHFFYNLKE
ncbi:MAG: dipeptidase [Anaerolineales bacterium]|jgi:acetylornithine deacetylase/succinyl-diaminopimelate desuccinylase-like protein